MIFLLKYWKYIAGAALIAGVIAAYLWHRHELIQEGENRCTAKYEKAMQESQERARNDIIKLRGEYEKRRKVLQSRPDSGFGVGPVTSSVLDGLRERQGDRERPE